MLLLSVMVTIFCFSAEVADESDNTSGRFFYTVVSVFYPEIKDMTNEEINELYDSLPIPVRKLAHFSIFGALGVCSFLTFVSYKKMKYIVRCVISFAVCVLYAVSDEIHQLFVDGRSCEFKDILIDSGGALLAILFLAVFCIVIKKIKKKVL